jgi:hypothetical protein
LLFFCVWLDTFVRCRWHHSLLTAFTILFANRPYLLPLESFSSWNQSQSMTMQREPEKI